MSDWLLDLIDTMQVIGQTCLCCLPVVVGLFFALRGVTMRKLYDLGSGAHQGLDLLQPGCEDLHYDPATYTPGPTFREEQAARRELKEANIEPTPMRVWRVVKETRKERTK